METRTGRIGMGMALIVTGAVIGAGTALLMAPRSGKETRDGIRRLFRKTTGMAGSAVGEVVQRLGKTRERLAKIAS